jgi:hypothetical protein
VFEIHHVTSTTSASGKRYSYLGASGLSFISRVKIEIIQISIQVCIFCSRKVGDGVRAQPPLQMLDFLNHEGHEKHEDFSFLRALCDLRGSSFYDIANPGLANGKYSAIRTIHLKWV